MKSRVVGAIALILSNEHGSYYFMSLRTSRKLNSSRWTHLPITDEVINKIKNMCINERQDMTKEHLVFEWEPGVPIDEDIVVIEYELVDNYVLWITTLTTKMISIT